MSYLERQIISFCGKAVHGWSMIADGERIAVALSGGKDSLSLLWLLHQRLQRVPIDFKLIALHVEMGYGRVDLAALQEFCAGLGVELLVRRTDIGPRAHSEVNRENPCFFCAINRRRELFQMTAEAGCRKLALAHHQDDIMETFLMNALYAGNISTMLPVQPFFEGKIVVIRPLSLVTADMTRRFAQQKGLPVQPACCPSAGTSRRARVGRVLLDFFAENKKVRGNLWHAITSTGLEHMPDPPSTARRRRRG